MSVTGAGVAAWTALLAVAWSTGCQCANEDLVSLGMDGSSTSTGEPSATAPVSTSTSTGASEGSTTGAPFDASRWIGRYHYETIGLEFGERGDPLGSYMLVNFEILPNGAATLLYDDCTFEVPITIAYAWTPDEPGWLTLHPGEGESSLRMLAAEDLDSLRIHLVEPCRELELEIDGIVSSWLPFRPGASCWYDRCLAGSMMRVDYCPGEEPPPCP